MYSIIFSRKQNKLLEVNKMNYRKRLYNKHSDFAHYVGYDGWFNGRLGKHHLGKSTIYPNQKVTGNRVFDMIINEDENHVLLKADMQSGKTGACIFTAHKFREHYKGDCQILVINNISDITLKNQTRDRFADAFPETALCGVSAEIEILHHANLKNHHINLNKPALVFLDEAHMAQGENRPTDAWFTRLGAPLNSDPQTWSEIAKKYLRIVSVSATPFSHDIYGGIPTIKHLTDKNCLTIKDMLNNQRFRQSQRLQKLSDGSINKEFLSKIIDKSMIGYHFIRCGDTNEAETLKNYIIKDFDDVDVPVRVDVAISETSSSVRTMSIEDIDSLVQIKPSCYHIILMLGALRAGKTLTTTENIVRWTEKPDSKGDTVAQSLRMLGHDDPNSGHNRKNDTFPVDINMREIEVINDYLQAPEGRINKIPSGVNNASSHVAKQTKICKDFIISSDLLKSNNWQEEIKKETGHLLPHKPVILNVSKHQKNNIIEEVITNDSWMQHKGKKSNCIAFQCPITLEEHYKIVEEVYKKGLNKHYISLEDQKRKSKKHWHQVEERGWNGKTLLRIEVGEEKVITKRQTENLLRKGTTFHRKDS